MRLRFVSAAALTVVSCVLLAAADIRSQDSPFPKPPPAPQPPAPPPPPPGAALNLAPDFYYVVNCKTEAVLRVHPVGLVTVTKETGPLRLRGRFADGAGAVETRTYAGPTVFVLEAVSGQKGRLELDLIPLGLKLESEILTATVDVNGGQGPQPPPKPDDPPTPPTPVKVESFRVIWVLESGVTPPAGQIAAKDAKMVRDFLNANTTKEGGRPGWREFDPNQELKNEQVAMSEVWAAALPQLPKPFQNCVVIQVNSKITIEPWPKDAAASVALFNSYLKGGK